MFEHRFIPNSLRNPDILKSSYSNLKNLRSPNLSVPTSFANLTLWVRKFVNFEIRSTLSTLCSNVDLLRAVCAHAYNHRFIIDNRVGRARRESAPVQNSVDSRHGENSRNNFGSFSLNSLESRNRGNAIRKRSLNIPPNESRAVPLSKQSSAVHSALQFRHRLERESARSLRRNN